MRAGRAAVVAAALAAAGPVPANVMVSATDWLGAAGWRLTDGATEAVVVPALMRVVRYGAVGGPNRLWTADARGAKPGEWANWGGDKTWLAPQLQWPGGLVGREWPPDDAWERGGTGRAEGDRVVVTGPVADRTGTRIVRTYTFSPTGEFVIANRVEQVTGGPIVAACWTVSQVPAPDAVVLPVNPASRYRDGFHDFGWGVPAAGVTRTGSVLVVRPDPKKWFKVGADAPVAAIAAVAGGVAFVQRAPRPKGEYPDGATGYGCPVEVYNADGPDHRYMELELLSPLLTFSITGGVLDQPVRWSLHPVPRGGPAARGLTATVDRLLRQE